MRDPLAVVMEEAFREARREGLSMADAADVVVQLIRSKIDEEYIERSPDAGVVNMQSVVSAATGDPSVQCQVGLERWQWTPQVTREHARKLFECAEAAEHDAAMVRWLTLGSLGLDIQAATAALLDLRKFRGDPDRTDWRGEE